METRNPETEKPGRLSTETELRDIIDTASGKLTEKDFAFLMDEVGALFQLSATDNIYEYISVSLNRLLENAIVAVNSFDEASNMLSVRAVTGMGGHLDRISALLGSHPIEIRVPMNGDAREGLTSGTLRMVSGGLYELATHAIPQNVCDLIEEILHVNGTYAMGITWRGNIVGSIAILARDEIQNPAIVEAFIDYSAVAIQRWLRHGEKVGSVSSSTKPVTC